MGIVSIATRTVFPPIRNIAPSITRDECDILASAYRIIPRAVTMSARASQDCRVPVAQALNEAGSRQEVQVGRGVNL
jgi:hypothetical protein